MCLKKIASTRKKFFIWLCCLFFVGYSTTVSATHLRAGQITVKRSSCSSLTFEITITVYTKLSSPVRFGRGILSFGDGQSIQPPELANTPRPDLGPDIGIVVYTTTHTYPGPSEYTISYTENNRNENVLNVPNSVNVAFSLDTQIVIDPLLGCDNSPVLLTPPIDSGCIGSKWLHNPGAYDPEGDSLSYQLVTPNQGPKQVVAGYTAPNAKVFYDNGPLDYNKANEARTGPPTFAINAVSGTITWDTPGKAGEYNIAFLVIQWRKIADTWVRLGYVRRDMQVVIKDCSNKRPELEVPADVCVEAGTTINEFIYGKDPDNDQVKLEAFSEVFTLPVSPATFSPTTFQPTSPQKAAAKFNWITDCTHVKAQPYQVTFKITDKPLQTQANVTPLVDFKTWKIQVVGPAPKWVSVTYQSSTRSASLSWTRYVCQNASTIQIWRKIGATSFSPPNCQTGMPDNLGYEKIAEVPASQSTYTDNNQAQGLNSGAQYCYRLVAVFPLPKGGESYVSAEQCMPPIPADRPVPTHVSVDATNDTDGKITVKWQPPVDADPVKFPPDFSYSVSRAEGLTGSTPLTQVYPGKRPNVSVQDVGLNTLTKNYNYRIDAYASNNAKLETSAVASQVVLTARGLFESMNLTWTANVPWSNQYSPRPYHLIYRGEQGQPLVKIDSVNVLSSGFAYTDKGTYQNKPLESNKTYCYQVITRGGYGNPAYPEPFENYSNISCGQPNVTKPCEPTFDAATLNKVDCDKFLSENPCATQSYSNTLTWLTPTTNDCKSSTFFYRVYRSTSEEGKFDLLANNVQGLTYTDNNLPSYAACYYITAVNSNNEEGVPSDTLCFDNCPHYELPNVFSPNGDACNELFSAYSDRQVVGEGGIGPCGHIDVIARRAKCARYVTHVDFDVVNRWGKNVFTYSSGGENSIYIDWNGKDNNGHDLPPGTYYYTAEVTFLTINPAKRHQTLKGWIQLVR